tara:strand:+ start:552 stop:872 length:321 start_codon:yes stop_codon:yes gene_type:complete
MNLDFDAIRKAYPEAGYINDATGAFKEDGTKIDIVQSKIDEARAALNAEAAANKYKTDRTTDGSTTYDTIGNQLGMLYDDIIAGKVDATGSFAIHNKAVKDANPKP